MATSRSLLQKLKNHIWIVLLITFLAFIGFGLFRGEAIDVLEKARTICLECIGIG